MTNPHKTILVVEDEEADAFFVKKALHNNGVTCPIHVVGSGYEAIAYLMGEGKYSDRQKFAFPTLIITDLKMPNGDGFEVLHHLRTNPEWSIIPTVVLTSSLDPDDVKKAYLLGASSLHLKPSDYESLREQLKVLYDYWMTCQVPEVDATGRHVPTSDKGRLGERFHASSGGMQTRHPSQGI